MNEDRSDSRQVVLGITGGIAAYKSIFLLRALTKAGHDVTVVPTPAALRFVGAATLEALSGHLVHTDVFEAGGAEHVRLGRAADLIIVAPATADFLARASAGRADDLLTATLLMAHCPVLLAPAMHTEMWRHPATVRNVQTLAARPGYRIVGPDVGPLAGKDAGEGRMVEPERLAAEAQQTIAADDGSRHGAIPSADAGPQDAAFLAADDGPRHATNPATNAAGDPEVDPADPATTTAAAATTPPRPTTTPTTAPATVSSGQDLAGLRVVVSAGGTRERIDPVRFIGNRSSGRQGIALAERAAARGAQVQLIAANLTVPLPAELEQSTTRVVSAAELAQAVEGAATSADVVVMAAAVADFRPTNPSEAKVKRAGKDRLTIELEPTEDVLAGLLAQRRPGAVIVGFAAETGDGTGSPLDLARIKAKAKGADLLVCNEVGETKGFDAPDNEVAILDAAGDLVAQAAGTKELIADVVWDQVARLRAGR